MADPIIFTWNAQTYRASESFHYFNCVRLPEDAPNGDALKLLFCDGFTGEPPEPVNLREPTEGDNTEGDRALSWVYPPP